MYTCVQVCLYESLHGYHIYMRMCACVWCTAHLDGLLLIDGPEGLGEKHRAVLSQAVQLHTHLGGVLESVGGGRRETGRRMEVGEEGGRWEGEGRWRWEGGKMRGGKWEEGGRWEVGGGGGRRGGVNMFPVHEN